MLSEPVPVAGSDHGIPARAREDHPMPRKAGVRLLPCVLMAMILLSRNATCAISATSDSSVVAALESPVFADTRNVDLCARDSIRGALCLPPSHLLHPDGTPASFRDLNWLAGAFGLDPAATVVVFGGDGSDTAFVAGMIFLLGQSRVVIWRGDHRTLLGAGEQGAGRLQGMLRSRFYTAPMRDDLIALDEDVSRFFGAGNVTRLDGPDAAEAAGWASDAHGGSGPLLYRRDDGARLVLAEDTREAVAHFARLLSRSPASPATVHLDGLRSRSARSLGAPPEGVGRMALPAAVSFMALALAACAVLVIRRRRKRRA